MLWNCKSVKSEPLWKLMQLAVPKKSKAERAMAAPVYNKHDFLTPTKKKHDGSNTSNEENVTITTQIVYLPKCLVILSNTNRARH